MVRKQGLRHPQECLLPSALGKTSQFVLLSLRMNLSSATMTRVRKDNRKQGEPELALESEPF